MLKNAAVVLVAAASAASAASCSARPARSGSSVEHQTYVYTCCRGSDVNRPLHPGETFTVHWIVRQGPPSDRPKAAKRTLEASLTGPYQSVTALKQDNIAGSKSSVSGQDGTATFTAGPVTVTNWVQGRPVSRIVIPATAATGWYNLKTSVVSAGGSSGGASIVRVTHRASRTGLAAQG